LSYVGNLTSDYITAAKGLMAFGPSTMSDLTVTGQFSVGSNFILADNSINTLGADLEIQPLKQGGVSFMAGLVHIDENGNVKFGGDAQFDKNVTIKGTLYANVLAPVPNKDVVIQLPDDPETGGNFTIKNASGSSVLTINNKGDLTSSGSASFKDILAQAFNVVRGASADTSITETVATSSAGVAQITQGEKERTIISPFVSEKSLIYITPASDTFGQTPFVARQTVEDAVKKTKGSFTVQIPRAVQGTIKFNWWIVN